MINHFTRFALCALLFAQLFLCSLLHAQLLEIHQLDVGQGDAALVIIRTAVGSSSNLGVKDSRFAPCTLPYALLIDSGPKGKGKSVIVPYLRKLGIDTLNAILLTHYHADHIAGVSEVLNSEVVLNCYDRGDSYNSKTFDNYVSQAGARRTTVYPGDTLISIQCTNPPIHESDAQLFKSNMRHPLDESSHRPQADSNPSIQQSIIPILHYSLNVVCLASGGNILNHSYAGTHDENTKSIALLLTCVEGEDTFKFFTAGDIYVNQESLIAANNPLAHNVNVMKISHHGSRSSTSTYALQAFSPSAVFISCGDNNSYGHPHTETLQKLDSQQSIKFVYQTEGGSNSARLSRTREKSITAGRRLPTGRPTYGLRLDESSHRPRRGIVDTASWRVNDSTRRVIDDSSRNIVLKVYADGYYTIQTCRSADTLCFHRKIVEEITRRFPAHHGNRPSLLPLGEKARMRAKLHTSYHHGSINITVDPPIYVQAISVYNILGSPLRVFSPNNFIGSLSISDHFSSGAYFILIKTPERISVKKILITE